ncbi:hypothetical protein EWM64_g4476 [Hericium alpestre]|uniref:Uncharacterized protein n=1 Tax=Hericium alpestre TaxID=135208 RepID=A0A4Y9ZZP8_9AGAM|nr:hypothetical protein EWM64_g4476 [Hericium alpestre]
MPRGTFHRALVDAAGVPTRAQYWVCTLVGFEQGGHLPLNRSHIEEAFTPD